VVLYEEPRLGSQFGASYEAYRRNVRRWWPRIRGWNVTVTTQPGAVERPVPRFIVVGVVENRRGEYLLCRMPRDRGVFPGEWGLPGGGIEPGETLEEAVRREIMEEVGLDLDRIEPLFFTDGTYVKTFPDGGRRSIYMVFLVFRCVAKDGEVRLNPEFETAAWVPKGQLTQYGLNRATVQTLSRLGLI
jgi:nucleoside triphosphatase